MFKKIQQLSFATRGLLLALLPIALGVSLSYGHAAPSQAASSSTGTIAYTDTSSIHLINPDGSNDHVIYTVPDTTNNHINELAWSPDGSQIAFISDQEAVTSFYENDVYAIQSNVTNFRKITNPPSVTQLASFAKGTVTLDVEVGWGAPALIFIYVAGAPAAQSLIPGLVGGTFHFTFNNVADFGAHNQPVVAISGYDRWFQAGIAPDVIPNETVYAGKLFLYSSMTVRVKHLSWKADGSALGYVSGNCAQLVNISSNPSPGDLGNVILHPNVLGFTCIMDYAAKPALANQLLYYEYDVLESHVYRATEGQTGNGTVVYTFDYDGGLITALHWLPDGSGFAYSQDDALGENSNLFLIKFGIANPTQLTSYTSQFTREFSFSPDGKSIVYELGSTSDAPTSLWILDIASLQTSQLVNQGARPTWCSFIPVNYNHFVFLPTLFR